MMRLLSEDPSSRVESEVLKIVYHSHEAHSTFNFLLLLLLRRLPALDSPRTPTSTWPSASSHHALQSSHILHPRRQGTTTLLHLRHHVLEEVLADSTSRQRRAVVW